MSGPRDYSTGTRAALFAMANGSCYAPGCTVEAVVVVGDTPVINVDIAHVYGAKPGAARYEPTMTDAERAAFGNLLLLCRVHHQLVDRIEPDRHPPELLLEWKRQREGSGHNTSELDGINEVALSELLEVLRATVPRREVTVEVKSGLLRANQLITGPVDDWTTVREMNPDLVAESVLVIVVRNVGALGASVHSVDVNVHAADLPEGFLFTLAGANDFPAFNPALPRHLGSGDSLTYLVSLGQVREWEQALTVAGHAVGHVTARVRLGSGEDVVSVPVPRSALPQ